jgi:formamidopyrimidine-DNA glycosylase
MPELPEVETVRQTLWAAAGGRRVVRVQVRRADVVHGGRVTPARLLQNLRLAAMVRHGKQLTIVGEAVRDSCGPPFLPDDLSDRPCVCVHLGMSGSLCYVFGNGTSGRNGASHVHLVWYLDDGSRIEFRDPRRFGGVWLFDHYSDLVTQRWSALGDDALTITPRRLHIHLSTTRRCIKAALLDQAVVAGLGNIYVDELLFACGLHPLTPASALTMNSVQRLVARMRRLLNGAIRHGGSTLRDYVDGNGQAGRFQRRHRVYGRTGQACLHCGQPLEHVTISGRRSMFCQRCQRGPISK